MRTTKVFMFGLLACLFSAHFASGHSVKVHRRMSEAAVELSHGYQSFMVDNFGVDGTSVIATPRFSRRWANISRTPQGWIVEGSEREDDGLLVVHHFYEPFFGFGLMDNPLVDATVVNHLGLSSFIWAAFPTDPSWFRIGRPNVPRENFFCWQRAREYQFTALTDPDPVLRADGYAWLFESLGHVIHLNQDLSQPGHTRDDEHLMTSFKGAVRSG